ncbi:flagellar basal body-associated FliL family protein [Paracoccus sp. S3-43]|uniref:flagellar basal body-associated FliL family protein n=1 Tax=Paracoccus sp. S3-43 TaxID=3030011 RepID=UPI0023AFC07A|nr:flagellar basal body-associated FliL family protein [Paracoccus sp. S3-43]WEF24197.1 flagellar basal body-associated FliL family protein [Paracoccus sp. S3-43]
MTDATADQALDPPAQASGKKKLVPILAAVLLAGGGFASTYLGLWSPTALLAAREEAPVLPSAVFVPVPTVDLVIPGGSGRSLVLSASLETDSAHQAEVAHLMPRVSDAFTSFLSGIDPAAYDKRGVLEIIRAELLTRTRYVLGESAITDLLITEFRFK